MAVKRLLKRVEQDFGDRSRSSSIPAATTRWPNITSTTRPALVVGDLVKVVGLAPSYESLVGAAARGGAGVDRRASGREFGFLAGRWSRRGLGAMKDEELLHGSAIVRIQDCIATPEKNRVIAELSDDVSAVFPISMPWRPI